MKAAVWLLALAACAGTPVPEAMSTPAPVCPACSTCDQPTCPTCSACPTCPACPKPLEPVAIDWQCLALNPPRGSSKSYCFPTSTVCDDYRRKAQKKRKKWGRVKPCIPQPSAFCFNRADPRPMNRQAACARTLEHCEEQLRFHKTNGITETTYLSTCQPTLNTDTYAYDDEGNSVSHVK